MYAVIMLYSTYVCGTVYEIHTYTQTHTHHVIHGDGRVLKT